MNGRTIYNVYDASGRLVHVRKMAGGGSPEERSDYVRAGGRSMARVVSGGRVYFAPAGAFFVFL